MILAEIVFVTRFLGLVAGEQHVAVQVDAEVKKVQVYRDGERAATMNNEPWTAIVNLGLEIAPHNLTAVAFDAKGNEVGRDAQAINVARPSAEIGVLLDRSTAGKVSAQIRWSHFAAMEPENAVVKLDGRVVYKGRPTDKVPLGTIDRSKIHSLSVDMSFTDGVEAHKEIVFGGIYSEEMPAELTPVTVRRQKKVKDGKASCFRSGETALPASTVERGPATAYFVLNGGGGLAKRIDLPEHSLDSLYALYQTEIQLVNPVAIRIQRGRGETGLFDSSILDGIRSTYQVLLNAERPQGTARIADAAGATGLRALRGGRRRVVVVVLGYQPAEDESVHKPATIRRYLERIGVPLRVWSLMGPRPDLIDSWGHVQDASSAALLLKATEDLRQELETQRVAWLPVAPLEAFRVTATADCAYMPLAR
ncbi:MAG TPA: hypothetical protein VGQ76_18965 [Thermoanaerobaculia bacterium]|jgi:hypothetical protein|nr:hypothetical protein [Thermoanaerobaculia bacterium]